MKRLDDDDRGNIILLIGALAFAALCFYAAVDSGRAHHEQDAEVGELSLTNMVGVSVTDHLKRSVP